MLIEEMYLFEHLTQQQIADKLGMTRQMVGYDIKQMKREWMARAHASRDKHMAAELRRYDDLERTYREQWLKSQEDVTVTTRHYEPDPDNTAQPRLVRMDTRVIPGGAGEEKWLVRIESVMAQRRKMLGVDAPVGLDVTSKGDKIGGGDILPDSRRMESLMALYDSIRARASPQPDSGHGDVGTAAGTASPSDGDGGG